jgi:hypothetical protein
MVIASTSPTWLHTLAQIASVLLLIELGLVLIIVCVLMIVLAIGTRWLNTHVVPVLREYGPRAHGAMTVAQQSSDKVVQGVAEFYGRRQQVETSLRVLLFGRKAAERVREDAMIQASSDLQLMAPDENAPSAENGHTPRIEGAAADRATRENGHAAAGASDDYRTLAGNAG